MSERRGTRSARAIGADKISNGFPVVGGLFRHSETVDRPRSTAVNRTFTIRTASPRRLRKVEGRRGRERNARRHFRGVVCMPFAIASSYTVTTPSCFRYACPAIFVPLWPAIHRLPCLINLSLGHALLPSTPRRLFLPSSIISPVAENLARH